MMATAQELAAQLYDLRSQIAVFQRKAGEVEEALAAEMTDKRIEVEGLGVFERRRKQDRKQWKHEDIRSALLRKMRAGEIVPEKSASLDTGEVYVESDIEMTFRVLAEAANPTWRVTALKRYDIDPDEYCEVVPGGYSIQIHASLDTEEVSA